jgi:hypothetical protein
MGALFSRGGLTGAAGHFRWAFHVDPGFRLSFTVLDDLAYVQSAFADVDWILVVELVCYRRFTFCSVLAACIGPCKNSMGGHPDDMEKGAMAE